MSHLLPKREDRSTKEEGCDRVTSLVKEGSAPLSIRSETTWTFPWRQAKWSGVLPMRTEGDPMISIVAAALGLAP
jgi:hypothetical protein